MLVEVAIGEAQAGDRAAEAPVIDLLHPEAWFDRQPRQMGAHGRTFYSECSGGQAGEAHCTAAARPDGADNRPVRKNAAHACGAVETSVGKQLADDERPG